MIAGSVAHANLPKRVALGPLDGFVSADTDVTSLSANGVGFRPRETLIVIGSSTHERTGARRWAKATVSWAG